MISMYKSSLIKNCVGISLVSRQIIKYLVFNIPLLLFFWSVRSLCFWSNTKLCIWDSNSGLLIWRNCLAIHFFFYISQCQPSGFYWRHQCLWTPTPTNSHEGLQQAIFRLQQDVFIQLSIVNYLGSKNVPTFGLRTFELLPFEPYPLHLSSQVDLLLKINDCMVMVCCF